MRPARLEADPRQTDLALKWSHGTELVVDNFAGGGGASLGIEMALGRPVDIAVNHDREAVAMHLANHPRTEHHCENVYQVDPVEVTRGRPVGLLWLSPDCKHFSKAKGRALLDRRIRGLAWVALKWAGRLRKVGRPPRLIIVENVEEFVTWGPLKGPKGALRADPRRRGLYFRRWVRGLERLGYVVEWRELRACDYGAPTIRKRFFAIARRDGLPIRWPVATHGKPGSGLQPYRTAAEIIDWSIPCPSIFEPGRDLVDATMARIAAGLKRYVFDAADPFIMPITHHGSHRAHPIREPLRTVTAAKRGEMALVSPSIVGVGGRAGQSPPTGMDVPLGTITSKNDRAIVAPLISSGYGARSGVEKRSRSAAEPLPTTTARATQTQLVAPYLVPRYGERDGQSPRARSIRQPAATVVATGNGDQLVAPRMERVAAFLAQHNTGVVGHDAREPVSTITQAACQQQVVAAHLTKLYGSNKRGSGGDIRAPIGTVTGEGQHIGAVFAYLVKYFGSTEAGQALTAPLHTVTAKARFGLVQAAALDLKGSHYVIADIGMRMLAPRELYRAQGFPDSYRIDPVMDGKPLTKTAQIRMCGNSVCPPLARALVLANVVEARISAEAAE